MFAPICFLYLIMVKTSIFSLSAKTRFHTQCPVSPRHQHKNRLYIWICPGTTSISVHRPKLTFYLKNCDKKLPLKPNKAEPNFRKLKSPTTKTDNNAFSLLTSRPGSYVCKLPVTASRIEPTYAHPLAYKLVWPTAWKVSFPHYLCWTTVCDTCLLGWLSSILAHSQTFKPTPTSFTQTNRQP